MLISSLYILVGRPSIGLLNNRMAEHGSPAPMDIDLHYSVTDILISIKAFLICVFHRSI